MLNKQYKAPPVKTAVRADLSISFLLTVASKYAVIITTGVPVAIIIMPTVFCNLLFDLKSV